MKIKPIVYGLLVISVFFGIILGFQAAGVWSTSGKVDSSGKAVQPSETDPTTIKGWMTLEQIVDSYNVPLSEILTQFGLPATTLPATALKDLESETFDTSLLIAWLQDRIQTTQNVPQATETPIPTFSSSDNTITPDATEHTVPDRKITAKTTFQDLIDWGISSEAIMNAVGGDLPPLSAIIKDYVTGKGLEFSEIKTLLQTELDK